MATTPSTTASPVVNLQDARAFAEAAHAGQTRRHGAPYITHPYAVAAFVDDIAAAAGIVIDDEVRAAALLHDVIEDSPATEAELAARFTPRVARMVQLLSKGDDDDVAAYYAAIADAADAGLRLIKICDRCHNLSELARAHDPVRARKYIDETLQFLLPLAQQAPEPGVRAALAFAVRTACRNYGFAVPVACADRSGDTTRVPRGVYAIVAHADSARVTSLLEGGVAILQLRIKPAEPAALRSAAHALLPLCRAHGVPLIINDVVDVARDADGVHVGQADVAPRNARDALGADKIVGVSTHTDAQLDAACADAVADYVAVGPVYLSSTKSGHADVVGVDALAARCSRASRPVVAIGGIGDAARAAAVGRAGAAAFAVIAALDVADPRPIAFRLGLSFFAAQRVAL